MRLSVKELKILATQAAQERKLGTIPDGDD
jgi:hypothetical protein